MKVEIGDNLSEILGWGLVVVLVLVFLLCSCQGPQGEPGQRGLPGHTPTLTLQSATNIDGVEFRFLADGAPISKWLFVAHGQTDTVIISHVDTLYVHTIDTIYAPQAWLEWQPAPTGDPATSFVVYVEPILSQFATTLTEMRVDTIKIPVTFKVSGRNEAGEGRKSEGVEWVKK